MINKKLCNDKVFADQKIRSFCYRDKSKLCNDKVLADHPVGNLVIKKPGSFC